ncbi:MAG: DUF3737 family protein [Bacteroidaceae bacterium]|nr:DUF3737 family protein [Bacteroidaceae bacterium]
MTLIENKEYGGERPLYCQQDLHLKNVTIHAGESGIKECKNILCEDCTFEGKYPLWNTDHFVVRRCKFEETARAALWYSRDLEMADTLVEAPKMFRDMQKLSLTNVELPNALETLWHCRDIRLKDCKVKKGDYIMMFCDGIEVDHCHIQGNYSFQYSRNIVIRNSVLDTKDAFWETDNCTVYDSTISGEFLAWNSRNLRLVRCHIRGTQPLCYCDGLVLEDCTFDPDSDLAFEYSDVHATVRSHIHSVKNPRHGSIRAFSYGEIILDDNIKAPADCTIERLPYDA